MLNGQSFTVIGIMRPRFSAPLGTPDVWLPVGYYPNKVELNARGRGGVLVLGKLKRDVALERAQAELDRVCTQLTKLYPTSNAGLGASIQTIKNTLVGDSRAPLLLVLGAVALVLLVACANVAGLQLARAATRRRELSVRAALGAGRDRLVRQLLTESLVVSIAGGLAGIASAYAAVAWLGSAAANLFPYSTDIRLSPGVLGFAALVTLATGILFGVGPSWQASRVRTQETLATRAEISSDRVRVRSRRTLVIGQMALSVVLLVSAALLTRSLLALTRMNPGFDPQHVLTLQFRLPVTKYDSDGRIADMFTRTLAEIRGVAGVQHAALVRATPLNGNGETFRYEMDGRVTADLASLPTAHRNLVSPDYFATMDLPRLQGRDFTPEDREGGEPVAIVNAQLAAKIAPGDSAIGHRIRLRDVDRPDWAVVVGVVGNAKHFQLEEAQLDQVYLPYTQRPLIFTEVVVRVVPTVSDPMTVANSVRSAIWRVDPDQPVWRVRPLTLSIEGALGARPFIMWLLTSFAIIAVVLAVIGVYGVMSFIVARRRQEMGIRIALGAPAGQVLGLVLRQGLRTIAVAIAIGLGLSLAAARALESQLFGVTRMDPLTFAAVPILLAAAALAACYLPARRASQVDPVIALREE
jgi:putative ABC transport system permease protein